MITSTVLDLLTFMLVGILDSIPPSSVPTWISTAGTYIPSVFSFASSMGVWFPWGVLGIVLASVFTVWGASFVVKLARIVISFFTFGGGSAA